MIVTPTSLAGIQDKAVAFLGSSSLVDSYAAVQQQTEAFGVPTNEGNEFFVVISQFNGRQWDIYWQSNAIKVAS